LANAGRFAQVGADHWGESCGELREKLPGDELPYQRGEFIMRGPAISRIEVLS